MTILIGLFIYFFVVLCTLSLVGARRRAINRRLKLASAKRQLGDGQPREGAILGKAWRTVPNTGVPFGSQPIARTSGKR